MNYKYFALFLCLVLVSSCGNDFVVGDYYDLEELPGYVAFDGAGTSVILDDEMTTEDGGTVSFKIECPTGTLSDITVNYSFGGDAVFGTDFTVAGATASGGSAVIEHDVNDNLNRDNVDLDIELLTDGVQDGLKTLTITLTSASNAEGELAVGRGGTDILTTATVIIEDID